MKKYLVLCSALAALGGCTPLMSVQPQPSVTVQSTPTAPATLTPGSTITPSSTLTQAQQASIRNWENQCATLDGLVKAATTEVQAGKFSTVELQVIKSANMGYKAYCAQLPSDPAAASQQIVNAISSLTALGIQEAVNKTGA